MNADRLAILGGTSLISEQFPPYRSIGEEEVDAANRVLRSGVLSAFIGAPGPGFFGGPEVQTLEREAAERFGSVTSWRLTPGLPAWWLPSAQSASHPVMK